MTLLDALEADDVEVIERREDQPCLRSTLEQSLLRPREVVSEVAPDVGLPVPHRHGDRTATVEPLRRQLRYRTSQGLQTMNRRSSSIPSRTRHDRTFFPR